MPVSSVRSFLFDFNVFPGNSGGPVYFAESLRAIGGSVRIGGPQVVVVGLVSESQIYSERTESQLGGVKEQRYQLGLAVVVEAPLIREAIDKLGAAPR